MELQQYIETWYLTKSKRANFALIRNISNNQSYCIELNDYVSFESTSTEQSLYHFINDVKDLPLCLNCKNGLSFHGLSTGYSTFCSKSCKTSHEHKTGKFVEARKKGGVTFKENYGKGTIGHTTILTSKRKTSLERYGVTHPMQNKDISDKYKKNSLEVYGETNPMKTKGVQDRVNQTNQELYGHNRPLQNLEIFEKMYTKYKQTIKERYNVDCVFQVPEVFEKAQLSSFKRNYHKHLHYQANFEHDFILHVEKLGIVDKLSNGPYLWYFYSGKTKRYFSDFFVQELNLIVEIKSTYWYLMYKDQNDAKRDECLAQGFQYILVLDKNYTEFNNLIKDM